VTEEYPEEVSAEKPGGGDLLTGAIAAHHSLEEEASVAGELVEVDRNTGA